MKLVVNSANKIIATHGNAEDLLGKYPSEYNIILSDDVVFDIKMTYEERTPEYFVQQKYLEKINEIKIAFEEDIKQGFLTSIKSPTTNDFIRMDADLNSIYLLDGACRKATRTGQEFMTICDYYNVIHENVYNNYVDKILIDLSDNYQNKLRHKWDKRVQIMAATIEQLDTIIWTG